MITLLEDSNEDWWKVCASQFIRFLSKRKNILFSILNSIKAATVNNHLLSICFRRREELMTELDIFLLTLFRECNKMRRFTGVSGHSLAARNRDRWLWRRTRWAPLCWTFTGLEQQSYQWLKGKMCKMRTGRFFHCNFTRSIICMVTVSSSQLRAVFALCKRILDA